MDEKTGPFEKKNSKPDIVSASKKAGNRPGKKVLVSESESDSESSANSGQVDGSSNKLTLLGKESGSRTLEVVLDDSRKWEDDKERIGLKRGSFDPEETDLLMNSLC